MILSNKLITKGLIRLRGCVRKPRRQVLSHQCPYIKGKSSEIANVFLFVFFNRMFVIKAGYHKMLVRIANREDPDQTASSEAV